jgi:WD40 repeat protein
MRTLIALVCYVALAFGADEPQLMIDSGGHQSTINFVAFTNDGKYVVSASGDKVVRVWDITSGKTIRTVQGQIGDGDDGKIYAAALSPDGGHLAVGGWLADPPNSGVIRLHDFRTGDVVALLHGHTDVVYGLAFSADGRLLASASADRTVRIWNVKTRSTVRVLSGHSDTISDVAFSPDGRRLVSASLDHTLRLWDVASGKVLKDMTGHSDQVYSVAFSSDGQYIASGSADRSIRLWEGTTGELVKQLAKQGGTVRALSFDPSGHLLLTGSTFGDDICHVFRVPEGNVVSSFSGHTYGAYASSFSSDGRFAATAGGDQNEIYVWNPTNGQVIRKLVGAGQPVWSAAFSSDGKSIAFGYTLRNSGFNDRGPLQQTLLLGDEAAGVSLGPSVSSESGFLRSQDHLRDLKLEVVAGTAPDLNVLKIVRSGEVEHEIPRDYSSGRGISLIPFLPTPLLSRAAAISACSRCTRRIPENKPPHALGIPTLFGL